MKESKGSYVASVNGVLSDSGNGRDQGEEGDENTTGRHGDCLKVWWFWFVEMDML